MTEPTSADHENGGTMSIAMPGARAVMTVVATETLPAIRPAATSAAPIKNKSTMSPLPPPGPPLPMMETSTRPEPKSHDQKLNCARRGNAIARAPTCSGTIAIARPRNSGARRPRTIRCRAYHDSCNAESPVMISSPCGLIRSKPKMAASTATSIAWISDQPMNSRPIFL